MTSIAGPPRGRRPSSGATLASIATQAGVSEATVSRVLNGRPGASAATRQAVLTALDVLGYERPERLRQRRGGLVGLVVPELVNPIFPAFAQNIETLLAQNGFTAVLCTQIPGGTTEDEYVEALLEHGVSGIVFVSCLHADRSADPKRYQDLSTRRLPIVLVNGFTEGIDAPFITADDAVAIEQAVAHLVALGHRHIGLAIGQSRFVPSQRKQNAFRAVTQRQLDYDGRQQAEMIESTLFTVEGGQLAASRLIERGATGVIFGSDVMALGGLLAARQLGLSVPDDVSIVGFDDSPIMAFTSPPLTTVQQPVAAMAEAAVAALIETIDGYPFATGEYLFRPELIVRSSTGPPRNRGHSSTVDSVA